MVPLGRIYLILEILEVAFVGINDKIPLANSALKIILEQIVKLVRFMIYYLLNMTSDWENVFYGTYSVHIMYIILFYIKGELTGYFS